MTVDELPDELPRVWGTHLVCPEEITAWWQFIYLERLYSPTKLSMYLCIGPFLRHAPARLYRTRVQLEPWPLELCLWPRRWSW